MAQYYTLDEAARVLGLSTDEFRRKLATEWKTRPRRVPDGATLRFPAVEVDEIARELGQGSDTELKLADSSDAFEPLSSGPKSGPRTGGKPDSDVKLEKGSKPKSGIQANIRTEEMDLDAGKKQPPSSTRKFQSPMEVSGQGGKPPSKKDQSSSEFELSLKPDSSDEFDLKLTEDDSDEVDVGVLPGRSGGPLKGDSGINLRTPSDSGISLEKSSSEFELQGESGVSKPKSGPRSGPKTAPKSGPKTGPRSGPKTPSKSAPVPSDESDSEFELTLDDTPAAQAADATVAFPEDQKDIFETDFELPALDDESGSEAVALDESDTDLESSDFDLGGGEAESGSEVVSVPESGRRRAQSVAEAEALDEFDEELVAEEDERPIVVPAKKTWGVLPALVLIPTVVIMLLAGLMSFELLRSMYGYATPSKPSGMLVRFFAQQFGDMPKD
jgi:hypothetical protein